MITWVSSSIQTSFKIVCNKCYLVLSCSKIEAPRYLTLIEDETSFDLNIHKSKEFIKKVINNLFLGSYIFWQPIREPICLIGSTQRTSKILMSWVPINLLKFDKFPELLKPSDK
jgi:hypothetical protein